MQQLLVRVDIACNDPQSGSPQGFIEAVTITDMIQLEGPQLRCFRLGGRLVIAGLTLPLHGYGTWIGNWCWDEALLTELDAWRLLEALRRERWDCTEAVSELFNAWDAGRALEGPLARALRCEADDAG